MDHSRLHNKIMISKHLEKINSLLERAKTETQTQTHHDSLGLISTHMARTTTQNSKKKRKGSFQTHKVAFRKEEIVVELEEILMQVFKAKCKDLKIEVNKRSW